MNKFAMFVCELLLFGSFAGYINTVRLRMTFKTIVLPLFNYCSTIVQLTLFLFMLGIFTNNHHSAASFNYFAFLTNGFYRWSNFHCYPSLTISFAMLFYHELNHTETAPLLPYLRIKSL